MLVKELPTTTLSELREDVAGRRYKSHDVDLSDIKFDLERPEEGFDLGGHAQVPLIRTGIDALSDWVDMPPKFLQRQDPDIQQYLLRTLLDRKGGVANVFYGDKVGITEIHKTGQGVIFPEQLVDVAARVISGDALVPASWSNSREFRLDVVVPDSFERGIGGDAKSGDLTKGGIRISQDRKKNLAPSVSEFLYRLVCTNGIEVLDHQLKVDARGNTVPEVLAEFEAIADRAFRRVERSINSFYDLRNQPIENPDREILRVAHEEGISDKIAVELAETAYVLEQDGQATVFDIVNHITNLANDDEMKDGPARKLQQTGGVLVSEHIQRCAHCRSKLN